MDEQKEKIRDLNFMCRDLRDYFTANELTRIARILKSIPVIADKPENQKYDLKCGAVQLLIAECEDFSKRIDSMVEDEAKRKEKESEDFFKLLSEKHKQ